MKLTLLTTLLAAATNVTALSCYGNGETHSISSVNYHAGRACKGYDGVRGAFQGVFGPGEQKSVCVDTTGAVKYEMSIRNNNPYTAFDLGDNDCAWRLEEIINSCRHGGTQTVAGWAFRFDPNAGVC